MTYKWWTPRKLFTIMFLKESIMANTRRYSVEFKEEAVKRALENGYSISEVAKLLGMPTTTL